MSMDYTVSIKGGSYDIRALHDYLHTAHDGTYCISVKRTRRQRTNDQNAYLWGVVYPIMLNSLIQEGWELTSVDEVHEILKKIITMRPTVNRNTGEVIYYPKSTSSMNTVEFASYIDEIKKYARTYLNTEIPDPAP